MVVMMMVHAHGFPGLYQSVLSELILCSTVLKTAAYSSRVSDTQMLTSVHVSSDSENPQDVQTVNRTQTEGGC